MRFASMIRTADGMLHEDSRAAKRHLDKVYADKLCEIGRALANRSYMTVNEFIDSNLEKFVELRDIKADMLIDNPSDGNE